MAKFKMHDHVQAVRSDGSRSPFMGRIVKIQVNENAPGRVFVQPDDPADGTIPFWWHEHELALVDSAPEPEGASRTFTLTPEEAYRLTAAAIDLVASVSANVHASLRRNPNGSRPGVNGPALLALADVLNGLVPGFPMADLAIQDVNERRRETVTRTRDLRGSKSGGEVAT